MSLAASIPAAATGRAAEASRSFESDDRKCAPALQTIQVGKQLGEGSFKTVFQVCEDKSCSVVRDVLQVVAVKDKDDLNDLRQEIKVMQVVQGMQSQGKPKIMLPIKQYIECPVRSKAFIIQERADDTMDGLGVSQAQAILPPGLYGGPDSDISATDVWLFTVEQLISVFRMAQSLYNDFGGLVHGDLKPANVFVKGGKFFLADFGFSGALRGQTFRLTGAPRQGFAKCRKGISALPQLRKWMNLFQMELQLRTLITLVEQPSLVNGVRTFQLFDKASDISSEFAIPTESRNALEADCLEKLESRSWVEDSFEEIRDNYADMVTDNFDLTLPETDPMAAVLLAQQQVTRPDYATLPSWARFLIRRGISSVLVDRDDLAITFTAPKLSSFIKPTLPAVASIPATKLDLPAIVPTIYFPPGGPPIPSSLSGGKYYSVYPKLARQLGRFPIRQNSSRQFSFRRASRPIFAGAPSYS
jgi:serine/threonine protein kinase